MLSLQSYILCKRTFLYLLACMYVVYCMPWEADMYDRTALFFLWPIVRRYVLAFS